MVICTRLQLPKFALSGRHARHAENDSGSTRRVYKNAPTRGAYPSGRRLDPRLSGAPLLRTEDRHQARRSPPDAVHFSGVTIRVHEPATRLYLVSPPCPITSCCPPSLVWKSTTASHRLRIRRYAPPAPARHPIASLWGCRLPGFHPWTPAIG